MGGVKAPHMFPLLSLSQKKSLTKAEKMFNVANGTVIPFILFVLAAIAVVSILNHFAFGAVGLTDSLATEFSSSLSNAADPRNNLPR